MKDAFHSVAYGGLETSLSRVIRIVVQMFVTKIAAFCLMLRVIPETVGSESGLISVIMKWTNPKATRMLFRN